MNLSNDYANFIRQLQWNYFVTCRTPYKEVQMTVRNWLTKLLTRSIKVEQELFVTEIDKGDYYNLHVHMLIGTNTDMTCQEVKYGMGNVSVGDYQPIYDSEVICKYVAKQIGKNVDYDMVFKS
jgi:hypothetical protein